MTVIPDLPAIVNPVPAVHVESVAKAWIVVIFDALRAMLVNDVNGQRISIDIKSVQSKNAKNPMCVTELGMFMLASNVQLPKA
jgi:hypothetical protein